MELKKVVYKERSTNKWAAEVINIDDPAAVGIQVWRGVYDSEEEARERKASAIASTLATGGLSALDVRAWTQGQRDAVAKRAGQRSPSETTWALVLSKLETRRAA